MTKVNRDDLELAFDFVNSAAPCEHAAYISLDSGEIFWASVVDPLEEELPEDLENSDRFLALPHRNDLGLGNLPLRFADERFPHRYQEVEAIFHRKGAYRRFKDLLASLGKLEEWYQFENALLEKALLDWCSDNDIQVV